MKDYSLDNFVLDYEDTPKKENKDIVVSESASVLWSVAVGSAVIITILFFALFVAYPLVLTTMEVAPRVGIWIGNKL